MHMHNEAVECLGPAACPHSCFKYCVTSDDTVSLSSYLKRLRLNWAQLLPVHIPAFLQKHYWLRVATRRGASPPRSPLRSPPEVPPECHLAKWSIFGFGKVFDSLVNN